MTTTKLSWYTYNKLMEKLRELRVKSWCSNYTTQFLTIIKQIFLRLVPIVRFVAIQTRSMGTKMGMNWSLCEYSTSNWCLHCLRGACDKSDNEWSHCIHTRNNQTYFKFACYGWCLPYLQQKIRPSIPVWSWHEKKKDPNLASILVHSK